MPDVDAHLPLTPLTHAILLALGDRSRHGYGVIKEIRRLTEDRLRPGTGTLYTALQRMESDGLISEASRAAREDDDPRRRYFALTSLGRRVARAEAERLARALLVAGQKNLLGDVDLRPLTERGEG